MTISRRAFTRWLRSLNPRVVWPANGPCPLERYLTDTRGGAWRIGKQSYVRGNPKQPDEVGWLPVWAECFVYVWDSWQDRHDVEEALDVMQEFETWGRTPTRQKAA